MSRKIEGEEQALNFFLEEIDDEELNILALSKLAEAKIKYSENKHIDNLYKNLLVDLFLNSSKTPTDFDFIGEEADTVVWKELSDEEYMNLSKYEKIKYKNELEKRVNKKEKSKSFIDVYYDGISSDFNTAYHKALDLNKIEEKDETYFSNKKKSSKEKMEINAGSIIFIEPIVFQYDQRMRIKERYIESEECQRDFVDIIALSSEKQNIKYNILDVRSLEETDIETFNNIIILNLWYNELMQHSDLNDGNKNPIICYSSKYIKDVTKKYNSNFIAVSGAFSEINKKHDAIAVLLYTMAIYPLFPIGLLYALTPEKHAYYFFALFDAEKNEMVYLEYKQVKAEIKKDLLNSFIYNSINKIKRK